METSGPNMSKQVRYKVGKWALVCSKGFSGTNAQKLFANVDLIKSLFSACVGFLSSPIIKTKTNIM